MSYDNTNSGILFSNDQGDNPKRPNYTGKVNVNGTEYKLAGWIKQGRNGEFISLKVDKMVAENQSGGGNSQTAPTPVDDERGPF